MTILNADKLSHQSIHHICIILSLKCIFIRSQTKFYHLLIGQIIKAEQVGTRFFDGRTICFQSILIYAGQQLSRTMPQTFMQIGMKVARQIRVLVYPFFFFRTIYKLIHKTVTMSSLIISICQIANSYGFRSVNTTNPIRVRQIDADSCCRI